jgi:hypothetical protein
MLNLSGHSLDTLTDVLNDLPPLELHGMHLLKQVRPTSGSFFPSLTGIHRDKLRQATTELITYTNHCHQMRSRLSDLQPVPITSFTIVEFGL